MESAHPIPQNVTAFEFHLVGDMTLKQFIYLATGVGIAYLIFILLAVRFPFIAWPMIAIFTLLGVAFAFVPISDRPLDHWLGAFLKAVYSPTKRVWSKNGQNFLQNIGFPNRLNIYLSAMDIQAAPISNLPQQKLPESVSQTPLSLPKLSQTPQPTKEELPTSEELTKTVELAKEAQTLQVKIIETERQLNQIKNSITSTQVNPSDYTLQFNKIFDNLNGLVQEASEIKKQLASITNEPTIPVPKVTVQVVAPQKPKQTQLTLTSLPNVINGITVSADGVYLEGVVVVIRDKDGLPVRALKTNKLGQFTGSTPLPNGTYTVELEKDDLIFDILQINLEGKVLPPLNIAAKRLAI